MKKNGLDQEGTQMRKWLLVCPVCHMTYLTDWFRRVGGHCGATGWEIAAGRDREGKATPCPGILEKARRYARTKT